MTNLQINDITFKRNSEYSFSPVLKLFNTESKEFNSIPLGDYKFNFELTEQKFCTGYNKDGQHFECKFSNKIEEKTAGQCNFCERIQGFKSAFIMGDLSHERSTEILSQQYFIYLAYFEPGIIKVGTANAERSNLRLMEQDCLYYCFIAKGTGYQIQKLEHIISRKLGITETVKSNHKFKYLGIKPNLKLAENRLNSEFNKIVNLFANDTEYSNLFFEECLFKNLTETNTIFFPDKYKKIKDTHLFGEFLGLRGRYLLIQNTDTAAFDINYLIGRFIEDYVDDYQYNFFEEQLTLL